MHVGSFCRRRCLRSDLPSPLAIRYGGLADSPRRWFWELSCESGLPWELEFGEVRCQALIRSGVRGVLSRCRPTLLCSTLVGLSAVASVPCDLRRVPGRWSSASCPGWGVWGGAVGNPPYPQAVCPWAFVFWGLDRASPKPKPKKI